MNKPKSKPFLPGTPPTKEVRGLHQAKRHLKEVRGVKQEHDSLRPLWSFVSLDIGGKWCWTKMDAVVHADVLRKLGNFEGMTWQDLGQNGCHEVQVVSLIKTAQQRLLEIAKDDLDTLYSLRISGKVRVWTIRVGNVLRLLWLDLEHEICPSQKKHT